VGRTVLVVAAEVAELADEVEFDAAVGFAVPALTADQALRDAVTFGPGSACLYAARAV
jgi:hypothetical protein